MLRRQQVEAVVMARQKLVDSPVGIMEVALKNLEDKKIVSLTSDQRAILVTNMIDRIAIRSRCAISNSNGAIHSVTV
ncbi:hypothetical protein SAMN05428977_101157 [Nitrosomonas sp. Nm166]|nr:hypothetical protein SAMN05428977_101157 [Nitrosomonas sp. Nm166]